MNRKRIIGLALSLTMLGTVLAGCGGAAQPAATTEGTKTEKAAAAETKKEEPKAAELKGEITFIHNRTDINGTKMVDYVKKFNEKYPGITVKLEAIKDYENDIKVRMNSKNYGDVLLLPGFVKDQDLASFFVSAGKAEDVQKVYDFANDDIMGGEIYGLPTGAAASGLVYNIKIFKDAGVDVTTLKTPEAFIAALKTIKAKYPDIAPLYTNYKDKWPLAGQWENCRTGVAGDQNFVASMAHKDAIFAKGEPHYVMNKMLYDIVKEKLTEADPMTSDWEKSKIIIGEGKIASMVLGSWAIAQCQEKAGANAADIGYMPFPATAKDGKQYTLVAPDYKVAVNKNSKNIEAAKAWQQWWAKESNYAFEQGYVPALKGAEFPEILKAFKTAGVTFITDAQAPANEEGWTDMIDKESKIGLQSELFRMRIVEAGMGNSKESIDDIFNDLNKKWADARAKLIKDGKIK